MAVRRLSYSTFEFDKIAILASVARYELVLHIWKDS